MFGNGQENLEPQKKNIGIKWIFIPSELRTLLDDVTYWIEHNTYSEEEICIRFKHRIVSIHCFPNGNGRHSRLIADLLLEAISDKDSFSWRQSSMVEANQIRKEYISALQKADDVDVSYLLEFAKK